MTPIDSNFPRSTTFDRDRIQRETGLTLVECHNELDSTNTRALALAANGCNPLPLLVVAERQSAGRGRGQNRWWSAAGALTFSIAIDGLDLGIPVKNWPLASLTAALAVAQTIDAFAPGIDVRIKWPNDVFAQGHKVCGILVETIPSRAGALIIGVGINVNNSLATAPPDIQLLATSLVDLTGQSYDPNEVLIFVVGRLVQLLTAFDGGNWQYAEAWRERCFLQGRTVQLETGFSRVTGICQGIDDQGALLLLTEGGVQRCFGGHVAKIF